MALNGVIQSISLSRIPLTLSVFLFDIIGPAVVACVVPDELSTVR